MTDNTPPTTPPPPHLLELGKHLNGRGFSPSACDTFIALFASELTVKTSRAVAELLLMSKQADTPTSASERENALARLKHIFQTIASPAPSIRKRDETELSPHRRNEGAMFWAGEDFFVQTLPQLSSRLQCLRWEDYFLVRNLRLTINKLPEVTDESQEPNVRNRLQKITRGVIDRALKANSAISSGRMNSFFPGYAEAEKSMDLTVFFDALEEEILAHIEINPLYAYVPWSHTGTSKLLPEAEVAQLKQALEESGFQIMDDFGHGKNGPKPHKMKRNDAVVGIGLMKNEAVYVSEDASPVTQQIIAVGLGPMFVKVCQDCFCDPRMARIVLPREQNEKSHGIDSIFDEIVLSEVTAEGDAHPLFAYKSGKLGARNRNVFTQNKQLDARNYPSYAKLRELVPEPGMSARFINTVAAGDAIDFGVAHHAPGGRIYVITANDTKRTVLDIAKALGNPLFLQTMAAFQKNSISMFGKFMRAMAQTSTAAAKK